MGFHRFYPLPKLTPGIALVISNDSYGLEACKHNANAFAELFTSFKFQLFKVSRSVSQSGGSESAR